MTAQQETQEHNEDIWGVGGENDRAQGLIRHVPGVVEHMKELLEAGGVDDPLPYYMPTGDLANSTGLPPTVVGQVVALFAPKARHVHKKGYPVQELLDASLEWLSRQ